MSLDPPAEVVAMDKTFRRDSGSPAVASMERAPLRLAYSVDEAAEIVGLGRTTLYDLMDRGLLRFTKVGRRRLIRHADLEALIADQAA